MMSDYQWCFENPRDAADLIEQQQARIAELERHNDELTATIYRLRDALQTHTAQPVCCGNVDIEYSPDGEPIGQQCCGWGDFEWPQDVVELLSATPQQNLNAVKRDAFIEGFMFSGEGFNGELYNDGWPKVVELFDTELQIKYQSGEEDV